MNDDNDKIMRTKLDFYIDKKIMAHIELKDKSFLNARIIEKESDERYIINERKFGLMHIWVSDIFQLTDFVEATK